LGLIWRILGLPISKQAEILKNLPNAFRHATNDVCEILYKGLQRILMGNFGRNKIKIGNLCQGLYMHHLYNNFKVTSHSETNISHGNPLGTFVEDLKYTISCSLKTHWLPNFSS
jgi:hypothetical protein